MRQSGLTLIELLITMAILGIVMTAVTRLFIATNKTYHNNEIVLDLQREVRNARNLLLSNLQDIGFNATIQSANSTHFTVVKNGQDTMQIAFENDRFVKKTGTIDDGFTGIHALSYNINSNNSYLSYEYKNSTTTPQNIGKIDIHFCSKPPQDLINQDLVNHEQCVTDSILLRNMYY